MNLGLLAYMHTLCELSFKRVTSELAPRLSTTTPKIFYRLDAAKGPCFRGSWFSPAGSLLFVLAR